MATARSVGRIRRPQRTTTDIRRDDKISDLTGRLDVFRYALCPPRKSIHESTFADERLSNTPMFGVGLDTC